MKKYMLFAAAAVFCSVFTYRACNSSSRFRKDLEEIKQGMTPDIEAARAVVSLKLLCNELSEMRMDTNTNWEEASILAEQLQSSSSAFPSFNVGGRDIKPALERHSENLKANIGRSAQKKAEYIIELNKPWYLFPSPAKKLREYKGAIQSSKSVLRSLNNELARFGTAFNQKVGGEIGDLNSKGLDKEDVADCLESFSAGLYSDISGNEGGSGIGASEDETGACIQQVFGNGLAPDILKGKLEAQRRKKKSSD